MSPFPDVNGGRWHISPSGGLRPVWARNGRELYYQEGGGAVMAVRVETTGAFRAGNPTKLFDARYFTAVPGRPFDVAADGRFVMIKERAVDQSSSQHAGLVLVLNWGEELKAKVPAK